MSPEPPDSGVADPAAPGTVHAGNAAAGEGGTADGARPRGGSPRPPEASRSKPHHWLAEWAFIIVIALLVAFLVRTFVAQTFYIPSTSMYPTLKVGNRIVVNKLAYDFHSVHRGDIVVFKRPPTENCGGPPVPDLVKRIIGLPGDVISASHGVVEVDGKPLPQPWLPKVRSTYTANFGPVTVPRHDYFAMGDNRVDSCDSRSWGPVTQTEIVGKVDFIVWPFSDFRFF